MVTFGSPLLRVPWLIFLKYAGFGIAERVAVYLPGFVAIGVVFRTNPFGLLGWLAD